MSLDEPSVHRAGARARGAWRSREPVAVLAVAGGDVRIATLREGLIATRWVAESGLGRAAMREVGVSSVPRAAPDPAVRIKIGYRLPAEQQAWLPVTHAPDELDGLELHGFVPAGIRGVTWEEPVRAPAASVIRRDGEILEAPHAGARVRATVTRDAEIEIRGDRPAFWEVTARTPRAEVDGFLAKPPPRPSATRSYGSYDFSDETIEGELVRPDGPLPPDTCLHDAPGGEVSGMILGRQSARTRPVPSAPGWVAVELPVVWGTATYYAVAAPE